MCQVGAIPALVRMLDSEAIPRWDLRIEGIARMLRPAHRFWDRLKLFLALPVVGGSCARVDRVLVLACEGFVGLHALWP